MNITSDIDITITVNLWLAEIVVSTYLNETHSIVFTNHGGGNVYNHVRWVNKISLLYSCNGWWEFEKQRTQYLTKYLENC